MASTRPTESVSIEYMLDGEVIDPKQCYGGIKIVISGDRLNKFQNEEDGNWGKEWSPEYAGDYLCWDMAALVAETTDAIQEQAIYEEYEIPFLELITKFIIEPLGNNTARIAFRASSKQNTNRARAVPASACGYPVDLYEWGEEVHSAGTRLQNELFEQERHKAANPFDSLLDELGQELDRDE